jgi:hypothetical protein
MKIQISGNLIKHYLRNVYFINGHSYAGKSTMAKMLAQRYGMICCGENYHDVFPREKLSRWEQPGLCYFDTMSGWEEWLNMTPEEHWNWTEQVSRECVEIEILELVKLSAEGKKIIVDTTSLWMCCGRFPITATWPSCSATRRTSAGPVFLTGRIRKSNLCWSRSGSAGTRRLH